MPVIWKWMGALDSCLWIYSSEKPRSTQSEIVKMVFLHSASSFFSLESFNACTNFKVLQRFIVELLILCVSFIVEP